MGEVRVIVTNEMLNAAIVSAVKDGIIPKHNDLDGYTHIYESIRRMIECALIEKFESEYDS